MNLLLAASLLLPALAAPRSMNLRVEHSPENFGPSPWRGLQGLNVNNVPHFTDPASNARHYAHDFVHDDENMGKTSLKYNAIVPDHVQMLDEMPSFVHDLSCTANSLEIHPNPLASTSQLDDFVASLRPGDILIASSGFGCHTHRDSGRDHGRHLEEDRTGGHSIIRRVVSVSSSADAISVSTTPAEFTDCLEESEIEFKWTPPHHGEHPNVAAAKRAEIKAAADRRELQLDIDAVIDQCQQDSSLDFVGNADLKCSLTEEDLFDFYADLL
jgi:hypothetical protein